MKLKYAAGVLALAGLLSAAPQDPARPPASDNTKTNQRDRSASKPTADQGKNNAADLDVMQKIRKSVMADKSLSTYAHNVKIIAQDGKVTLRGPVRTQAEKETIEKKAVDVAGAGNVVNELTVKPAKKS